MHLLVGAFFVFVIWSHPVLRSLLLIAFVAALCFTFLPAIVAWNITAVVTVGLWAGAAEEMRAIRQWDEDSETIRRAQVRRARRYLHS